MTRQGGSRSRELSLVVCAYLALTVVMTWPLVRGIAGEVPGDLGDSLLNMWILGWGAEHLPRVLTGAMSPAEFADANIFHPEPLALAFSEHLTAQVLQILPVYHLTDNLILCYNLLFLSSFVLSGLGMYLLVRDITGNRYAAFFAGLVFAFVPYRVAQISHIQSLSAQWMPLALYGFRRYIITSRVRALVGGALALVMQNWSCGYYLVFFAPLVVLFVIHQIAAGGRPRDRQVWLAFAGAGLCVAAASAPFLYMYLEAQRVHGFERPLGEIIRFSADVYSYFTASESLRVTGPLMRAWPKPEGELFLGFVPAFAAIIGIAASLAMARSRAAHEMRLPSVAGRAGSLRKAAVIALALVGIALVAAFIAVLFTGGVVTAIAGVAVRATNAPRLLSQLAVVLLAAAAISPLVRRTVVTFLFSPAGLAALSLLLALWLSLGPIARTRGQVLGGLGLYAVFLEHVPGFGGLRVPARYAMVAAVYLSVLAGIGAGWLTQQRSRNTARAALLTLSLLFLVEALFAPLPLNQTWGDGPVVPPPRIEPRAHAPAVYQQLAALPGEAVVAEFPFGDPAWELRYVYYSTVHWKRVLNGYSGGFPQAYKVRVARLQRVAEQPEDAWAALREAGTTHVVVHERALPDGESSATHAWLRAHGAREMGRFDSDVLYDLTHAP